MQSCTTLLQQSTELRICIGKWADTHTLLDKPAVMTATPIWSEIALTVYATPICLCPHVHNKTARYVNLFTLGSTSLPTQIPPFCWKSMTSGRCSFPYQLLYTCLQIIPVSVGGHRWWRQQHYIINKKQKLNPEVTNWMLSTPAPTDCVNENHKKFNTQNNNLTVVIQGPNEHNNDKLYL